MRCVSELSSAHRQITRSTDHGDHPISIPRGPPALSQVNPNFSHPGGHTMKIPFLLGRLLFGGFFLYNGINHFKQRKQLAQYAGSKNVPMAELAVTASGVALLGGGASILLGV